MLKWLENGRSVARDQCEASDGPNLFRSQGAAICLRSILENAEQAPQVTQKFKNQE